MREALVVTTASAAATEALGYAIGNHLRSGDLVVLAGDLGSGKTTFAKGVARALGVEEPVTSPTFTIVQEYEGRVPVAHVDVYRLERIQDLHDFGFEELLDHRVVLVEWGDTITGALPADRLEVRFVPAEAGADDDLRRIEFVVHGARWAARRPELEHVAITQGTS